MNEVEYYNMCEDAAIGEEIARLLRVVMADNDARTLGQMQRSAYKYTDAGVHVYFRLHDGGFMYSDDERRHDPAMVGSVRSIMCTSIVEGSDYTVPAQELDLLSYANDDLEAEEQEARLIADYDAMLASVSADACEAFDNNEEEED